MRSMEKWTPFVLLPAFFMVFLFPAPHVGARQKNVFRAGAYAQNITPKTYPVSVNGGMSDVQAKGAHDPLHARCLVLDDGKSKLALCVIDACMVPRTITDEARRLAEKATGIPAEHILISATHAHRPDPGRRLSERAERAIRQGASPPDRARDWPGGGEPGAGPDRLGDRQQLATGVQPPLV